MTRVGWSVLALLALAFAGLAAMTHVSGAGEGPRFPSVYGSSIAIVPVTTQRLAQSASRHVVNGGRVADGSWSGLSLPTLGVPLENVPRATITDTWGQARGEGRVHHGTDIVAPKGAIVVATAAGTIEKLWQSTRGGTTIYERSIDRHWTFYYAHLAGYAHGLHEGQVVRAGEPIGFVGDTGDAGAGNYHLHFGLAHTTPKQRWYQGEDVNAYPALAQAGPRG